MEGGNVSCKKERYIRRREEIEGRGGKRGKWKIYIIIIEKKRGGSEWRRAEGAHGGT